MNQVTAHQSTDKLQFGFWLYIMTDCVLFASLFASYAVLQANTFGGPAASQLFDLPFVLVETLLLLTSSLTSGLLLLAVRAGNRRQALTWLGLTMALGASFLAMELFEFYELAHAGNDWTRSGFLSAFFTLVGTHGLHIAVGLLWAAVLAGTVVRRGLGGVVDRRLMLFGLFWHFLDIIWIFIFTFVYMIGAL